MKAQHARGLWLVVSLSMGGCFGNFQPRPSGPESDALGSVGLRLLTNAQVRNSLRAVFGPNTGIDAPLDEDSVQSGLAAIGSGSAAVSAHAAARFENVSHQVAEQALQDDAHRARVMPCAPTGARDAACMTLLVQHVGRRLFRRPLTSEESDIYARLGADVATSSGDFYAGARAALAGLIQSPKFLYRFTAARRDNARRQDAFSLATNLAFFVTDSGPDDELLSAAEAGLLDTPAGVAAQATRLMEGPAFATGLVNFFDDMLRLDGLASLNLDATLFPLASPASARQAMTEQVRSLVRHVLVDQQGDYRDLYTTRTAFINDTLAPLYDLPVPGSNALVASTLPDGQDRVGLLGHAGMLALTSHTRVGSPTRRGRYIRSTLLCQPIPAPPPDVPPLPDVDASKPMTTRDRLAAHRAQPTCAACHNLMDPIGLSFEHFDASGKFRRDENGLAIDTSGELGKAPFTGPAMLATLLHDDPALTDCLVRQMARYALGRIDTSADEASLASLKAAFADGGYRLKPLLLAIVQSDAFMSISSGR